MALSDMDQDFIDWDRLHLSGAVTEPKRIRARVRNTLIVMAICSPALYLIGRYVVLWIWRV